MIEIPEATIIAKQIKKLLTGKKIMDAQANQSPHKFAWYFKEPAQYPNLLIGQTILDAKSYGGLIHIETENLTVIFADGVNIKYFSKLCPTPKKHQLKLVFNDETTLICTIRMYGGLWAVPKNKYNELEKWLQEYINTSIYKPSPMSEQFTLDYFFKLIDNVGAKESVKATLATKNRIPGLGNGVLQDILFESKIHPKRMIKSLSNEELVILYHSIRHVLEKIVTDGGRDSESDLFNQKGGYKTLSGRYTHAKLCSLCNTPITKESFLGGSIYYCSSCQIIKK